MAKQSFFSIIKKMISEFITLLENHYFSATFSLLIIMLVYWFKKELWGYLFAILLAYLCADLIKIIFIRGGNGIVQFPISGSTLTRHRGHGYLIFLFFIILGTVISGLLGSLVTEWISTLSGWLSILLPNFIIIVLVYVDFYLTFYK